MKILILLLISSFGYSQENPYKITKNDIMIGVLQAISGSADAVNQAVVHHKFGAGNQFWDNKVSWLNKYKEDRKTPKYFGSTSVLIWTTDGFHLTRFIDRTATIASVGISFAELQQYAKKDMWIVIVKKIVISYVTNRIFFTVIYNQL